MKKTFRNIIFDMGGVLLNLDKQRCIDNFSKIGFNEAADYLGEYRQRGIFLELERGTVSNGEFFDFIRSRSDQNPTDNQITEAFVSFITGMPLYKLQLLEHLRSRYRVYMLSNTNAVMMPVIAENYFTQEGKSIEYYFDRLFLSYEMGMVKPDSEIFEDVIRDGGFDPSTTLFLDDGEANIKAARKLGFQTYQPQPEEDFRFLFDL